MNQFEVYYASKRIPILPTESYTILLILRKENLVKQMKVKQKFQHFLRQLREEITTTIAPLILEIALGL